LSITAIPIPIEAARLDAPRLAAPTNKPNTVATDALIG
jgi:hypothetical protein